VSQIKNVIRGVSIAIVAVAISNCVSTLPKDASNEIQAVSQQAANQDATAKAATVAASTASASVATPVPEGKGKPGEIQAELGKVVRDTNVTQAKAVSSSVSAQVKKPAKTASESPRNDGLHDSNNDAIVVLQSPAEAMIDFPRDRRMEVDWVQALAQGHIEPRANVSGGDAMETMEMDIVMKNTQDMPWVKFPHGAHTQWLACSNCHPAIFIPQKGANSITMNKVLRGEFCGVCHDRVAFSLFVCERCHSVPHEGSGPQWW